VNIRHNMYWKAQGLVEYILLLALLLLVSILILQIFGISIADVYCRTAKGLGMSSGICSQAYCSDDFSQPGGWNLPSGWTNQNGQLCTAKNAGQWATNLCSKSQSLPANYTINANDVNLISGDGFGIAFRQQDTPRYSGYTFQYDPGLKGFCLRKWVNGSELPCIAYAPAGNYSWYNQPRDIRVEVVGDVYKAYVDGNLVLTAQDSTYPAGGSGLRTWDSTQACFDQFIITPAQ